MTRLLARELSGRLYSAVLLVGIALVGLFAFFDLINLLDSGLDRSLGIWRVLGMTLVLVPGHLYELFPVAVLIGGLLVMSQLASSSEYTVMRTAGVSVGGIAAMLWRPALLFASLAFVTGEWLAPAGDRLGREIRLGSEQVVAKQMRQGFWLKDGYNFVNVSSVLPQGELLAPVIFEFDERARLQRVLRAASARYDEAGVWSLRDATVTRFAGERSGASVERTVQAELRWDTRLGPDILSVLAVSPERMSVFELWPYLQHLRDNAQDALRYEIALWSKLIYPFAVLVMLVLALPFARLSIRAGGVMPKVFAGILLGVAFHFASRATINLGQLNAWQPVVSAALPTLVFLLIALVAIWRIERV